MLDWGNVFVSGKGVNGDCFGLVGVWFFGYFG